MFGESAYFSEIANIRRTCLQPERPCAHLRSNSINEIENDHQQDAISNLFEPVRICSIYFTAVGLTNT